MSNAKATIASDTTIVASDGIYRPGLMHPRGYVTFPRFLRLATREWATLDLSTAIHLMTGRTAARDGLKDRGVLRVGAAADVVVFDPEKVADGSTFEEPRLEPVGIREVFVNGYPFALIAPSLRILSRPRGSILPGVVTNGGRSRSSAVDSMVPIRFTEPSQDAVALQKVAHEVAKILTSSEEILYIALQNVTAMTIKKDAVVVTSNRIIGFSPGVLGRVSFHDYQWRDVLDVSMKQGILSTEIVIETASGKQVVGSIDKEQAKRLYGIAQQLEQEWREKRRVRDMEEARAKAGGVYMGMPGVSAGSSAEKEDPVAKLAKAKAMLDQNLISETEYEALKAKVLADF